MGTHSHLWYYYAGTSVVYSYNSAGSLIRWGDEFAATLYGPMNRVLSAESQAVEPHHMYTDKIDPGDTNAGGTGATGASGTAATGADGTGATGASGTAATGGSGSPSTDRPQTAIGTMGTKD